jgi:thymidylate synthase
MNYEQQYLDHMKALLGRQRAKADRTGTGTLSIFGHQIVHDLRSGFPLLTTKKVFFRGIVEELLWFIRGETNIKSLVEKDVHIWDSWANEEGELGPIYGAMWRAWPTDKPVDEEKPELGSWKLDQLNTVLDELIKNPTSRRLIVSAWNPTLLPDPNLSAQENVAEGLQALPPCHTLWQLNSEEIDTYERRAFAEVLLSAEQMEILRAVGYPDHLMSEFGVPQYYLDLQLYQRSADWFLGVPFNAASYSLLLMMIAKISNMVPRNFIHSFGDTHLYLNHVEFAERQVTLVPQLAPVVKIRGDQKKIEDFKFEDFEVVGYTAYPSIKAPIAV